MSTHCLRDNLLARPVCETCFELWTCNRLQLSHVIVPSLLPSPHVHNFEMPPLNSSMADIMEFTTTYGKLDTYGNIQPVLPDPDASTQNRRLAPNSISVSCIFVSTSSMILLMFQLPGQCLGILASLVQLRVDLRHFTGTIVGAAIWSANLSGMHQLVVNMSQRMFSHIINVPRIFLTTLLATMLTDRSQTWRDT